MPTTTTPIWNPPQRVAPTHQPGTRRPPQERIRESIKPPKVPPNFTFGWELEACRAALAHYDHVATCNDGSVHGDGIEYKIRPEVVRDPRLVLQALRALTLDRAIGTDSSCGFHVHIGLPKRSRHAGRWAECFVALAREIEDKVFNCVPPSRKENTYCRKWSRNLEGINDNRYHANKYDNSPYRYSWVNVVEMFRSGGIRTVEIRLMGDTRNYLYLYAWSSFCRLMAQSAWRVMSDISALHKEAGYLKNRARFIEDAFMMRIGSRPLVAVDLAIESGLKDPTTHNLRHLRGIERILNEPKEIRITGVDVMRFMDGHAIPTPIGLLRKTSKILVTETPDGSDGKIVKKGDILSIHSMQDYQGRICLRLLTAYGQCWSIEWKNVAIYEGERF